MKNINKKDKKKEKKIKGENKFLKFLKGLKISTVVIVILVAVVCVESALLITGKLKAIPQTSNGEDVIVSFNDGTNYTVDSVWEETKSTYGLSVLMDDIDNKILAEEFADQMDSINEYVSNTETSLKANYVDDNGNYSESKLLSALSNYGYSSLDQYLQTVKLSYMKSLATKNYAKTLVTDAEVKTYYDSKVYADISAVHILVKPASSSTDDTNAAKTKAEQIIAAIKADVESGTSVADAFAKYKDDSSVTYQDLGTFNYTDMDSTFSAAAYALGVNEYTTTPVKTSYGYHIILKTGESDKASIDDKRDSILTSLAEDKVSADSTLSITAMVKLRESYGVTFVDSTLKDKYDRYINYQLNNASSSSNS
ncbi:MAG TPA: peptidylprolyl isomerase [Bacilli bacterium]|jgi:foldase protein PrsA|nr:peptidylprolyl isomerase [Bacilli bacterium]HQC84106.1 peptidylprolyl isomerase [Bacilli bacterium]